MPIKPSTVLGVIAGMCFVGQFVLLARQGKLKGKVLLLMLLGLGCALLSILFTIRTAR